MFEALRAWHDNMRPEENRTTHVPKCIEAWLYRSVAMFRRARRRGGSSRSRKRRMMSVVTMTTSYRRFFFPAVVPCRLPVRAMLPRCSHLEMPTHYGAEKPVRGEIE
jgi:hypothetical protein